MRSQEARVDRVRELGEAITEAIARGDLIEANRLAREQNVILGELVVGDG